MVKTKKTAAKLNVLRWHLKELNNDEVLLLLLLLLTLLQEHCYYLATKYLVDSS